MVEMIRFGQHFVRASEVFLQTSLTAALVNLKPIVPGHVLVIPRRVVRRFNELTREEVNDLFENVQKIGVILERLHGATSLTVSMQDGPDAGQTVHHVHVHILPRKAGDFARNDDIYDELQKWNNHLDDEKRQPRDLEDMANEASLIRSLIESSLS